LQGKLEIQHSIQQRGWGGQARPSLFGDPGLTQSKTDRRQCPTRLDGADTLIAHWITDGVCSDRQHRNYHKCFGCSYGNGSDIVVRTLAPLVRPAQEKKPVTPSPAAQAI